MISPRRLDVWILIAFWTTALVVVCMTVATWFVSSHAADATRRVAQTHEVLYNLVRARGDAINVELSSQNYRLTGKAEYLKERDAIIESRERLLRRIRALTVDNVTQQRRWLQLREVIDERVRIAMQMEAIRKAEGVESATRYADRAPLQETRERMYGLMAEMEAGERALLGQRVRAQDRANARVVFAEGMVSIMLFLFLTGTYFLLRRQIRQTEAGRRALAASEESLTITLQSIGDGVLATDRAGRVVNMNPVAEALSGWPLAEAKGRPATEVLRLIHEETREPAEVPVGRVIASGTAIALAAHTMLISRNGEEHPIADSAAPIRDPRGVVMGAVLVFRDESEERLARRLIQEQNRILEERVEERTLQLRESEEHLRSLIGNVPALIAFVDVDERYVYANDSYLRRFAPGRSGIFGLRVAEVLGADRYRIASPMIRRALAGEALSYDWQPFPDVWQVISYVPRRSGDEVTGYYVLGTDITERKKAEQKIASLNAELLNRVTELQHVSRALRTLSAGNRCLLRAACEQQLLDDMCRDIVAAGSYRMACVWLAAGDPPVLSPVAQTGHPGGIDAMLRVRDAGGGDLNGPTAVASAVRTGNTVVIRNLRSDPAYAPWQAEVSTYGCGIACPLVVDGATAGALAIYSANVDDFSADEIELLTESAGDLAFGIAVFRRRAEQEKIQEAIHRKTYFDHVTGLPNDTSFSLSVAEAIPAADGKRFAVLQLNVERLRQINEALGFSHGDHLLKLFGERLLAASPPRAVVARLRGDDFAILLPDSGREAALTLAAEMEGALAQPFNLAGLPIEISARIGIVLFPDHAGTLNDMFRRMDIAVNLARKRGKRHAVFEPDHAQGQARRLVMVSELRQAIEQDQLQLYLQPKVTMSSGAVSGAEALVRWRHPERGMILPNEFIELAEQTMLIRPLTEWVVRSALLFIRTCGEMNVRLAVAVNLSAANLRDTVLMERIRNLAATQAGEGLLEMELTESMLMEDAEEAIVTLNALRRQGIRLYIDDFGTGYSSLSYLRRLPVDYIKIDRSFVSDMLTNKDSASIVRSTVDLAHDLGRQVVAEGVETDAQWNALLGLGCDFVQGNLVAMPMPATAFLAWLAETEGRPSTPA